MIKESAKIFAGDLKNAFKDLLPIIVVVALFQGAIIQAMPANLSSIIIGLVIVDTWSRTRYLPYRRKPCCGLC